MAPIAVEILLGVITFGISSILGVLILARDIRSWTNRLFFLLALLINVYIVVNFLSLHPPSPTPESQLFWIRVVMFVTSFLGPILVLLVHTFPSKHITLKPAYTVLLLLLMTASAIASLAPFVFQDIRYHPTGAKNPIPIPGVGMPIFLLDFVGLFVLSFIILVQKYRSTKGIERARNLSMLAGIVSSFSLMALATVIAVTFLQTSEFVFLGPIFPIILMSFIAYAIIKHGLFDLKVFAGQLLIAILWIILFARISVPASLIEKIIDISIFGAALVVGTLTLRSFQKEVNYRAQEAAYAELQKLDAAKSEFITIASHQFRTPLSAIKGYLSMFLEGAYKPKEAQTAMSNAYIANQRLISLVDSLFNVSRMQAGKINLQKEEVQIEELMENVVQELRPRAQEKVLTLEYVRPTDKLPQVFADREKIRMVLVSIVDNAIRYTKKGSIAVNIKYLAFAKATAGKQNPHLRQGFDGQTKLKNRGVLISVADAGKGMTAEELQNAFTSFRRGKPAQALWTEGVGLSLYIAKQFVEAHGGRIYAESPGPEKGSTFFVELPIVN